MKKKILLLCFAIFGLLNIQAQSAFVVGGYVTNLNGGAISNHAVYITSDSVASFSYSSVAYTNSNGYYSFALTVVPPSGTLVNFTVSTFDCNWVAHVTNITNANPQNMVNFSICSNTSAICQAMFTHVAATASNYTVNFQDVSTGTPVSWAWVFSDGSVSSLQNPTHSFGTAGIYTACLTITTANNCSSTYCDSIFIPGGTTNSCQANYTYYTDSIATPNVVHFINTSTTTYVNNQVVYLWNFGDGSTSALQNPIHSFAANSSGAYNVCLLIKVLNANGGVECENTYCHNVIVGPPTNSCQNSITFVHQNLVYTFEGHINSTNPTTYTWSFGDGSTASGQNVTHTFALPAAGSTGYHVCLTTVTYNAILGTVCSDSSCQFVTVAATTNSCHANFTFTNNPANTNAVYFSNTSTTTYTNLTSLYFWEFGDSTTSTLQNPVHTYAPSLSGSYNVCLTMKLLNSAGVIECQNTICKVVTLGTNTNPCQNSFTFTHQNLVYVFAGHINSTNPTTYSWSFGDGTTASGQNVTHTFAQPAPTSNGYHVCLITSTNNTSGSVCTDTSCQFIAIANPSGTIIQGHVYAGNYFDNDGYVLIYQANNTTMSYTLIDTLALDSMGYFQYNYVNVPPINPAFIIKAVLNPTSSLYNHFAPTFYQHTLNWFNATPIFPSAITVFYNISMIELPLNPVIGNGAFGGNVYQGGIKSSGDLPLQGVELILTDENDAPLKINYSATNGSFNFNNLPMGNYKLHIEIAGVNYTPYPFTLSNSNPSINNITITVNNSGAIITGIENEINKSSSISEIYPNPATSEAFLEIKNSKPDHVVISIYDNKGIKLSVNEYTVSGNQRILLNQKQYASGIYTVKIETSNGMNAIRKLVISK